MDDKHIPDNNDLDFEKDFFISSGIFKKSDSNFRKEQMNNLLSKREDSIFNKVKMRSLRDILYYNGMSCIKSFDCSILSIKTGVESTWFLGKIAGSQITSNYLDINSTSVVSVTKKGKNIDDHSHFNEDREKKLQINAPVDRLSYTKTKTITQDKIKETPCLNYTKDRNKQGQHSLEQRYFINMTNIKRLVLDFEKLVNKEEKIPYFRKNKESIVVSKRRFANEGYKNRKLYFKKLTDKNGCIYGFSNDTYYKIMKDLSKNLKNYKYTILKEEDLIYRNRKTQYITQLFIIEDLISLFNQVANNVIKANDLSILKNINGRLLVDTKEFSRLLSQKILMNNSNDEHKIAFSADSIFSIIDEALKVKTWEDHQNLITK